jgi:hypothetical protein
LGHGLVSEVIDKQGTQNSNAEIQPDGNQSGLLGGKKER